MEEQRSLTVHYVFRTAIMAGLAFYVLHLVKSGRLVYYIAPRMEVFVKCAAIALFVFALYQAYLGLRSFFGKAETPCECEHLPPRSVLRNIWLYGLFLLPLTLGFLLPDKLMGSDIASIKGMNLSSGTVKADGRTLSAAVAASAPTPAAKPEAVPSSASEPASAASSGTDAPVPAAGGSGATPPADAGGAAAGSLDQLFAADETNNAFVALGKKLYAKDRIVIKDEGFMELLTTVDMFLDRYVGKQMELTGFIYREPDMKDNQFVVSRLAMVCCSADTSPYGVLVESPMGKELDKDEWVKIVGTIGTTTYRDNRIMVLNAKSIGKAQTPESPYVYPYFDEFAKLVD